MLKKIVIGIGIVVILLVAFALSYFFYFTRLSSPEANLHFENESVQFDIKYCQPGKKGRLIFGKAEDGALVPWAKYWRLGANQATEIEFQSNVLFNDKAVEAGRYRMYAIPDKDSWTIRLNSEIGEWGVPEPDYSKDKVEIQVPVNQAPEKELFTISAQEIENGALLSMHWDQTKIEFPITKK